MKLVWNYGNFEARASVYYDGDEFLVIKYIKGQRKHPLGKYTFTNRIDAVDKALDLLDAKLPDYPIRDPDEIVLFED